MFSKELNSAKMYKNIFGAITTSMFIIFFAMHISLSYAQYNVSQMNKFNQAVVYSLFPDIDYAKKLSPK